jgi:hypothetical protein
MKANFEEHTAKLQSKESRQREVVRKEKAALDELSKRERDLASEQGGLKANRRVSCCVPREADYKLTTRRTSAIWPIARARFARLLAPMTLADMIIPRWRTAKRQNLWIGCTS